MTFTLDTTGEVRGVSSPGVDAMYGGWTWKHLSPFAQGYVGAMLRSDWEGAGHLGTDPDTTHATFSDLAPETLAAILKDCAMMEARKPYSGDAGELDWSYGDAAAGAQLWEDRQAERWPESFPPLTLYLDDTGKVRLRAA